MQEFGVSDLPIPVSGLLNETCIYVRECCRLGDEGNKGIKGFVHSPDYSARHIGDIQEAIEDVNGVSFL